MKKQYVSWKEYQENINILAAIIGIGEKKYKYIYAVPRGGLILGVILSYRFNLPLLLTEQEVASKPKMDILIVDDIVDSGSTLFDYYIKGYHIATVYFRKQTASFTPEFHSCSIMNDNWLVFPYDDSGSEDTISKVKEKI